MAEVPFRPARQLSEYKGKGASASREKRSVLSFVKRFNCLLTLGTSCFEFLFSSLLLFSGIPLIICGITLAGNLENYNVHD